MVKDLHKEKLEQEKKQKDKELLIEELQRTVKMLEKKVRARETWPFIREQLPLNMVSHADPEQQRSSRIIDLTRPEP